MSGARVLIVDEHHRVAQGLSLLVSLDEDTEVVGLATNAKQAVERTRELRPDVVVMDFAVGGIDGIEVARRIKAEAPRTGVILMSVYEPGNDAERARHAGVDSWVQKSMPPQVLLDEVRAVVRSRAND